VIVLSNMSIETLSEKLKEGITTILSLEPALGRVSNKIKDNINRANMIEAGK
jgi:effector-binding domain-containing protein